MHAGVAKLGQTVGLRGTQKASPGRRSPPIEPHVCPSAIACGG